MMHLDQTYRWRAAYALALALLPLISASGQDAGAARSSSDTAARSIAVTTSPAPTVLPAPSAAASSTAAGTPRPTLLVPQVIDDPAVKRLIAELHARDIDAQAADASAVELLRDAPGQSFRGLGDGALYVHLYPDAAAAARAVPRIEREFLERQPIMDWIAEPHVYRCQALIVLYLGSDPVVNSTLTEQCGPQFAGGWDTPPSPEPTQPPLTTPDRALEALVQSTGLPSPERIEQLATIPLDSGIAVLFSFDTETDDGPASVTYVAYLDRRAPLWYPDGGTYELRQLSAAAPPVQMLSGSYVVNGGADTPERPDSIALAGGIVSDAAVRQIRVSFADGTGVTVTVVDGAYLVAKPDAAPISTISALDRDGTVLHEYDAQK